MTDNNYLDIVIPNIVTTNDPLPKNILASYNQNFTVPLIQCPSKNYFSVLRFTIPLDTVPLFSFPVNIYQNNPNQSLMQIGIQLNGGTQFTQFVIFVPQAQNISAPIPGGSSPFFTNEQVISQYYYIYSIQAFINMINSALNLAFIAAGSPGGTAPFYIYRAMSQTFSLIVTQAFLNSGAQIFMNSFLNNYLFSFYYDTINDINTGEYQFFHNLSTIPYGSTVGGPYEFIEEYSTIPLWFDIRKILLVSNSIPIVQQASPTFNSTTTTVNNQPNYLNIITDFAVTYDNIADISSVLTYNPGPQYRLLDMLSNTPISRFDVQVFWLSKNGNTYPLYISPNQTVDIFFGWFDKSLYKNEMPLYKQINEDNKYLTKSNLLK